MQRITDWIRREPAITNALLALVVAVAGALVDALEASDSTWAALVVLVLGQAGFTRRKVTPV